MFDATSHILTTIPASLLHGVRLFQKTAKAKRSVKVLDVVSAKCLRNIFSLGVLNVIYPCSVTNLHMSQHFLQYF